MTKKKQSALSISGKENFRPSYKDISLNKMPNKNISPLLN